MDYTKLYRFVGGTFTFLGVLCISSGILIPKVIKYDKTVVNKVEVTQQKVAELKSNEIILKKIEVEINSNLSVNVQDYLEKPNDIDSDVMKMLKLDISNVNTTNSGNYTYTITYGKKIYNGSVVVKPKPLPVVNSLTLKSLSYEVNTELPADVTAYIQETLSDEVKANIKLDLSNVNSKVAGNYLYSVSYNGQFYTSTITIYESNTVTTTNEKKQENTGVNTQTDKTVETENKSN